jgi:hypothetical protein
MISCSSRVKKESLSGRIGAMPETEKDLAKFYLPIYLSPQLDAISNYK